MNSSPIRLCIAARYTHNFLGERARGLARYMSPDIRVSFLYTDTAGLGGKFETFWSLLREARRQDVLWLISQHPARVLAAFLSRLLFGTRFIVDTADLLYESAIVAGKSRWRCELIRIWENLSVRLPDAVVVHGTYHKKLLEAQGVRCIEFIPDGVEVSNWMPLKDELLRNELGLESFQTIGILATIGWEARLRIPSPGWDLVECLVRLRDMPVKGVVVGDGPGLAALEQLCADKGVAERVVFVGRVPYDQVSRYFSVMDICLHTALNNEMSRVRTTGKLPIMLACGCCLVVSSVGEAARVLDGTGMLLEFDQSLSDYGEKLAERVSYLLEQPDLNYYRQIGPEIAKREFDNAILGPRAEQLVKRVMAHHT